MKHRKIVHRRYHKPPLRGGTLRYRADTTKQRHITSAVHIFNARPSYGMRVVHVECSRTKLLACAAQQQPRSSSSRLQAELRRTEEQPRLRERRCFTLSVPRAISASFLGCFSTVFCCLGTKNAQNFLRGSASNPNWDPPLRYHPRRRYALVAYPGLGVERPATRGGP